MSIRCQVGQYQLPHLLGSQSLLFEVSLHLGLEVLCLLLFTNLSLLLNCLCLFFLHSAGKERRNLSETTGIPQRYCGFGSRPPQLHKYSSKVSHMNFFDFPVEPFNFSFFSISGWDIDLDYCDIELFSLEMNRDHSLSFLRLHPGTAFWTLVDYEGYSIFSIGFFI